MKITSELLEEIAKKYCKDKTPLSKLALEYGVSKSTLVRYFSGANKIKLPQELQQEVDEVKKENWIESKATRGNLGHKSLTDEEIVDLANKMVESGLVLEDLVDKNGPTKSTIYNLFTQSTLGEELYKKIVSQYAENKSNAFDTVNKRK